MKNIGEFQDALADMLRALEEAMFLELFCEKYCDPDGLAMFQLDLIKIARREAKQTVEPTLVPKQVIKQNGGARIKKDHRTSIEWRIDILKFALDHSGVFSAKKYREGPFSEHYGADAAEQFKSKLFSQIKVLVDNEHLVPREKGVYRLTPTGKKHAEEICPRPILSNTTDAMMAKGQ